MGERNREGGDERGRAPAREKFLPISRKKAVKRPINPIFPGENEGKIAHKFWAIFVSKCPGKIRAIIDPETDRILECRIGALTWAGHEELRRLRAART